MSEYEILSLAGEHVNTINSLLQWWVGITLAVLVGVHVVGKDLNGYIASLLIGLYVAFTTMISFMSIGHSERMVALNVDLRELSDQGVSIGNMAQIIVDLGGPPTIVVIFGGVGFYGLFLSTVAYVIYCYRKARQP